MRTVQSVLTQKPFPGEFEIIVVNDAGRPLPLANWQQDSRVQVIHTQQRERCFARNTGAAVARGDYLHFLDDDDWLLPSALTHLWQLAQHSPQAVWLYGGIQIVNNQGDSLAVIKSHLNGNCFAQVMGGAWAPIQVSLVKTAAFWAIGGYDQVTPPVIEDLDLCRRMALVGDFASTEAVIGCMLRDLNWGTSTAYETGVQYNRETRDRTLEMPGVLSRLRQSARACFWRGRVVHAYLSAVMLNLRQHRLMTAISRALNGLALLLVNPACLLNKSFWQALRLEHVPNTLYYVLEKIEMDSAAGQPD